LGRQAGESRHRSHLRVTLFLAALAAAGSLIALESIEQRRITDDCPLLLDRLMWASLFAGLGLVLGLVGFLGRGAMPKWLSGIGIVIALGVGALVLIPSHPDGFLGELGTYVCGSTTP
jgi:peptidoglycan/LPS O-acetylase OafA/YrhL